MSIRTAFCSKAPYDLTAGRILAYTVSGRERVGVQERFHIHIYGKSGDLTNWERILNRKTYTNRLYYILEEGAGYLENHEKHYFLKNHIYLLSHRAQFTCFLEDPAFSHLYINYTDDSLSGYDRVIDVDPAASPLLRADAEVFRAYLDSRFALLPGINRFSGTEERLELILASFLWDIERLHTPQGLSDPMIVDSLRYIHTHFSENITVRELAARAYLSRNRFTDLFSAALGITPYQYIRDYRFDVAIDLLKAGVSVGDAAEKCGFESGAAFSSSFRKKFGFPPTRITRP
ncbi:MAG: helix-turn-helix transcriptional regulator [Ruminococcaceae bacterium]|nr:helix-turn-helix transcriptional regulator [Oscillospiraceae bacterium]